MQDMIKRILDADKEAQALEERNLQIAQERKERIKKQAQAQYDACMAEAMETIRHNDALEEQKTEREWSEIHARQQSAMIKLNADFDNNRDRWVDELVARVIG